MKKEELLEDIIRYDVTADVNVLNKLSKDKLYKTLIDLLQMTMSKKTKDIDEMTKASQVLLEKGKKDMADYDWKAVDTFVKMSLKQSDEVIALSRELKKITEEYVSYDEDDDKDMSYDDLVNLLKERLRGMRLEDLIKLWNKVIPNTPIFINDNYIALARYCEERGINPLKIIMKGRYDSLKGCCYIDENGYVKSVDKITDTPLTIDYLTECLISKRTREELPYEIEIVVNKIR